MIRVLALASTLQVGWTLIPVSPLALPSSRLVSTIRIGGGHHGGAGSSQRPTAWTPWTRATAKRTTALSMSLIPASDTWAIWAVLSGSAAAGCSLGNTKIGEALGAPVLAMAVTFALSQFGVLPPASAAPSIGAAQGLVVRLATPLLLYSANLRRVAGATGPLLPPFFLGSVCTTLGSLAGYALCGRALGTGLGIEAAGDAPKLAAALAAKNIGGGLNYGEKPRRPYASLSCCPCTLTTSPLSAHTVAVCETLKVSPIAAAAGITIDNIMALIYFPLVNWLGRNAPDPGELGVEDGIDTADSGDSGGGSGGGGDVVVGSAKAEALSLPKLTSAFAFAVGVIAVCERLAPSFSLVASTFLTVACATLFPRRLGPLAPAGEKLGTMALYIFFATGGSSSAPRFTPTPFP